MSGLSEAWMYLRALTKVPSYVRVQDSDADLLSELKSGMERREEIFLEMVKKAVFENPSSPYLFLFREAGCEAGDVVRLVRDRGLDEALSVLSDSGVYVTFDEFKGRTPIVRNGKELKVTESDFNEPALRSGGFSISTSGSSGPPTRLRYNLNRKRLRTLRPSPLILCHMVHGVRKAPTARLSDATPSIEGLLVLMDARMGQPDSRWFRTIRLSQLPGGGKLRLWVGAVRLVSRLAGVPVPRPETVTPVEIAKWMREQLDRDGRCLLQTGVSNAVRVAAAATEHGVDLTGAVIMGAGEPATPAKADVVRRSGARWVVNYVISELGYVGFACPAAEDPSDVHLIKSTTAIVQRPYKIGLTGETVGAFRMTNLKPIRPKIMINVELDDFGVIEDTQCGCPFQELGFDTHLRQIFSHSKLTGEGVTLVGGWTLRILEEFLPARFGGTPLDYQLIEDESQSGQTRVTIAVHPRLGPLDEDEIIRCFLDGLSSQDRYLERAMWESSGTLRVARREPIVGGRDKVLPLYRAGKSRNGEPTR